jgi:UDP-N-acetylmuramyl pentapeptide phosphotransferase/UDP-N-acetylglucosamine-1-phosphate transferase
MFEVLLSLISGFAITYLAIPVIITVSERKRLFDIPDERKVHETPIPSLGGLGIFAGFIISVLVSLPFQNNPEVKYILAATVVIFFLGLKDDILIISPVKKFIGQVIASFLIIYCAEIQLFSLYGVLGFTDLPQAFSLILTYFTVMVVINSYNLIDGVDGLAGSLGVIATTFFGFYFLLNDQFSYAILSFGMAGSVVSFLIFNYQPAKIFMGDTGSMLIGTVTSVLVIKFIEIAQTPGVALPLKASPAIGFTVMAVPLLDTLRVFAIRIRNRRSPFAADRNHIHHILLDCGMNHRMVSLSLSLFTIVCTAIVFLLNDLGSTILLSGLILVFYAMVGWMSMVRNRRKTAVIVEMELGEEVKPPSIVKLGSKAMAGQEN